MFGRAIFSTALSFTALAIVCPLDTAHALNTGEKTASTTISSGSWSNCTPTRLQSADGTSAIGSGSNACEMGGLGITIPTTETIDGIVVKIRFKCNFVACTGGGGASAYVQIGTGTTTATGKNTLYTEDRFTYTDETLGSSTDKWGVTWTAADFASSSIRYLVSDNNLSGALNVDKVTMTVYYSSTTPPTSSSTVTTQSSTNETQQIYGLGVILLWAVFLLTTWAWA